MSASPFVSDVDFQLYVGDVREVLATLPDGSVHCCVTSPPYWGLRDYGTEGQLGLEATPDLYVAAMVDVFREVRRVLRADGTLWLNLGDSYAADRTYQVTDNKHVDVGNTKGSKVPLGLKAKDLVGIPWRVAFALQADGWYLRSDIVWSKPNPMPESVTDRPTKAHEYIFMLSKAPWNGRDPGPIETRLSDEDARWLALLVDAEGNICVKRVAPQGENSPQYGAQVAIGSTSRALLERAAELVGAGNINEREGTNAPMYYWQVSNKVAQDLLYALYPHLIVKPRQARIAIHLESLLYHRGNATKRTETENATLETLWQRNKACNQFGDPDLLDVPQPKYGRWGPSRYFFDQESVREPQTDATLARYEYGFNKVGKGIQENGASHTKGQGADGGMIVPNTAGRNIRSVWEIATQPYTEAHFATFAEALVERCIKAGCPLDGTVLDCFMGSGTTALVARKLGRKSIGIELSPQYAELAAKRLSQLSLLADSSAS